MTLALFVIMLVDSMSITFVLPIIPPMLVSRGYSALDVGVVLASFALAQCIASPLLGRAADRLGRKRVLVASQFGSAVAKAALVFAPGLTGFVLARSLDGVMAAGLPVAQAYAASLAGNQNRRGVFLGSAAAFGIGLMAGPLLASVLFRFDPSAPIWAAAMLSCVSGGLSSLALPSDRVADASREKPRPTFFWNMPWVHSQLLVAYVMAVFFYAAFALYTSGLALFVLSAIEWHGAHVDAAGVSLVFAFAGLTNVLAQYAQKRWSAHATERSLVKNGLLLMAGGYALLWHADGVGVLLLSIGVSSVGSALVRPNLGAFTSKCLPNSEQAFGLGINLSVMSLCNVVCPLLTGSMFDAGTIHLWIGFLVVVPLAGVVALVVSMKDVDPAVEA